MECHCLPSSQLPQTSRLFADYLESFSRVEKFYAHAPTLESVVRAAREVKLDPQVRAGVVEVLREQNRSFGAGEETLRNIQRLADGAIAVVTGQQVGLFSGPAYSFYKALTAIWLARELGKRKVDAVPVFWMATEDHDLAEVTHSYWPGRDGYLQRVELAPSAAEGQRVGEIALSPGIDAAVRSAGATLEGPGAEAVAALLRETYTADATFGSAFARLMARLLGRWGIVLLDPLDARLHRLAAPLYRSALDQHGVLGRDLTNRGKALEKARYHTQVKVSETATLLFLNVEGQRVPLRVSASGGFVAGRRAFSHAEAQSLLDEKPQAFSANVLLRPVVQDFLLPTAGYVAGPAEIAYFAQAEVVYQRLLGRMPPILPRAGFTLVPRRIGQLLKKYRMGVADVWRGRQHIRGRMERQHLTRALTKQFDAGEKAIQNLLKKLRRPLEKLDRTLLGALDNTERRMMYQFMKLRAKAGRAADFRTGVLDRHERLLLDALFPHHALQERHTCLLSFLAAHGVDLLERLEAQAGAGGEKHQIVFL